MELLGAGALLVLNPSHQCCVVHARVGGQTLPDQFLQRGPGDGRDLVDHGAETGKVRTRTGRAHQRVVVVDHDHRMPGVGERDRGHQPLNAGAQNDNVCSVHR